MNEEEHRYPTMVTPEAWKSQELVHCQQQGLELTTLTKVLFVVEDSGVPEAKIIQY